MQHRVKARQKRGIFLPKDNVGTRTKRFKQDMNNFRIEARRGFLIITAGQFNGT